MATHRHRSAPARPRPDDPAPAPPTLADQQRDFTAEGSPPPGAVSGTEPVPQVGPPAPERPARPARPLRKRASQARYP